MKKAVLLVLLLYYQPSLQAQFWRSWFNRAGSLFADEKEYEKLPVATPPLINKGVPASIDLSDQMPPVGDQKGQKSCVAWALGYACRSYYVGSQTNSKFVEETQREVDLTKIISPSFIYNLLNRGENKGIQLLDALRLLKDQGACSMYDMPYHPVLGWKKKPNAYQMAEAKQFQIENFSVIDMTSLVANTKAELANGHPVVIGACKDDEYYRKGFNTKERFYLWATLGKCDPKEGHAILLVGYNDSLKAFKFMNSIGANWGNDGFGWMAYKIAPQVIREAYVIQPKSTTPKPSGSYLIDTATTTDKLFTTLNNAVILQKTDNQISEEDFRKNGMNVLGSTVIFEKGAPTPKLPDGETNITMMGSVFIPADQASTFQIVVKFYLNDCDKKGAPVYSFEEAYRLPNDQAAASTDTMQTTPGENVATDWSATIPLSALDIAYGPEDKKGHIKTKVQLIGEPVLFVNGSLAVTGKIVAFDVVH